MAICFQNGVQCEWDAKSGTDSRCSVIPPLYLCRPLCSDQGRWENTATRTGPPKEDTGVEQRRQGGLKCTSE